MAIINTIKRSTVYRLLHTPSSRGFALLIAMIFVSVIVSLSVAASALGYKQQVLASTATRSLYAFYAADAALECALIEVLKAPVPNGGQASNSHDPFSYYAEGTFLAPKCGGFVSTDPEYAFSRPAISIDAFYRVTRQPFAISMSNPLNQQIGTESLCAEVTVYETPLKAPETTFVYVQGYDVPCEVVKDFRDGNTTQRIVTRGLSAYF